MLLELAVFHPESLAIALRCGVSRLELCTSYAAGGLSPDPDFFSTVRKIFPGDLFVMIRPRPGDFCYGPEEQAWMLQMIRFYGAAGADGFVLGCLKNGDVDAEMLDKFVVAAGQKPLTFHRAIDQVMDYDSALEQLIASGCSRVLTSGRADSAPQGAESLAKTIEKFGDRITILAGGGIRSSSLNRMFSIPGLREIHSAAISDPASGIADEKELLGIMTGLRAGGIGI